MEPLREVCAAGEWSSQFTLVPVNFLRGINSLEGTDLIYVLDWREERSRTS